MHCFAKCAPWLASEDAASVADGFLIAGSCMTFDRAARQCQAPPNSCKYVMQFQWLRGSRLIIDERLLYNTMINMAGSSHVERFQELRQVTKFKAHQAGGSNPVCSKPLLRRCSLASILPRGMTPAMLGRLRPPFLLLLMSMNDVLQMHWPIPLVSGWPWPFPARLMASHQGDGMPLNASDMLLALDCINHETTNKSNSALEKQGNSEGSTCLHKDAQDGLPPIMLSVLFLC